MSVLELCDREIASVPLEATVADAINKMLDHHVGAVAVVDSEYRVAEFHRTRRAPQKWPSAAPTRKPPPSANS